MSALHTFRAARVLAGIAAAGALLLSPAVTVPAAAAPAPAVPAAAVSSSGLCGSPQAGHRACMVRVATAANGKRLTAVRPNSAPSSGYSPADIQSAYGISGSPGGNNQTVAVIDAYDNPNAEADLAAYRSTWNLPPCTTANGCFRKTNQTGGTSLPRAASPNNPNDPSYGWGSEIDLDIQAVSAACPLCHILLIEGASSADSDFMASIATAPSLGATELSLSWGGCESPSGQAAFDTTLNNAGLPITASSGDFGYMSASNPYQQNFNTSCPSTGSPSFPASSPYVTAVGGTSLAKNGGTARGWTETAWAYSATSTHIWGGGSGCSTNESKPAWQVDSGCAKRMVADVSAVADPNTGLAVYDTWDSGGWGVYGGTSLSAPLIAGIYALSGGEPAGLHGGQPWYQSGVAVNDITSGSNAPAPADCASHPYFCNAGAGYDGPTGVGSPAGPLAAPPPPSAAVYTSVPPFRVADTRSGSGSPLAGQSLGAGRSITVPIWGAASSPPVPTTATAAVLNVTATNGTHSSYLTVYPSGTTPPVASNINMGGRTVANLVTVPIGGNGAVGIFNYLGSTDVVVDLEGYFVPGSGPAGLYNALAPARITDTRTGSGLPNSSSTPGSGGVVVVQVLGAGLVPASGVSAVVLNVTAVSTNGAGFLTVYPGASAKPLASNLNFGLNQVVPNRVIVKVGTDGNVDIYNSKGYTDIVVDVGGWFTDGSGGGGARFTPMPPTRIVDSRSGSGLQLAGQTMNTGATRSVDASALPAGTVAVAANFTVTGTTRNSFLTVYPNLTSQPTASDLNWAAGQVVPNLVIAELGSDGKLAVFNRFGLVDVVVDVFGYWAP